MLIFDLEANGLYQDATRIHCIAYHDSTIDETLSFNDECPGKGMSNSITTAVMDLAQADYIVVTISLAMIYPLSGNFIHSSNQLG